MTTSSVPLRAFKRVREIPVDAADGPSPAWSTEWTFFTIVFATWCLYPLGRRLLDWHNGFYSQIQITSLTPYVCTLFLAAVCFRPERLARITPAFKFFAWVWIGTFGYGFIVAAFRGNIAAGAYDAVQYVFPMLAGIWLAGQKIDHPRLMQRLSTVALVFGGIVAIYGCAQFADPLPWDVLWVQGSGFTSVGNPEPFQMRIFSTMNQNGAAAVFFVVALMLTLPFFSLKRFWIWPFIAVLGAALMLTLVRSLWVALIVGIVTYLITSPRRFKALPVIAIFVVFLSFLVVSLPAFLGAGGQSDVLSSRLQSFADVDHDPSALARTTEIQDAFQEGLENPLGLGLGLIGASSALTANPDSPGGNNLDSGYMARWIELGWGGFIGYIIVVIGGLGLLVNNALRNSRSRPVSKEMLVIIATASAICAALAWCDAAGDNHLGVGGFLFWIAMGIGFRGEAPDMPPPVNTAVQVSNRPVRRSLNGTAQ